MGFGGAIDLPAIRQRIVVDDGPLSGLAGKFGSIGKGLGIAVAAGAATAAAGVAAFVAAGVKGAIDVERGIAEVVTLFGETGDAAADLAADLTSGVADLSNEVGIAQDVLVGGLYQAISAGVPQENVFEFMRVASEASIAGVTDVETAVDGLTTTINAFGLDAADAGAVADSMFAAVQGGKTTFEELSASLFQVAPAAAAAGISFEEVNAGIATLTSQGTPTAVATTRMRAAIDELAKPGTKVGEIFERVAGKSFRQFIEEGGNLTDALGILQGEAESTGAKIGDYFGSVEAAGAATSLAATGADKMRQELARQADAAGAAGDAFDTMNATTGRAFEQIKVQISNAAIAVGQVLLPPISNLLGLVLDRVVPAIQSFAAGLGDLLGRAQGLGDGMAGVGSIIGTVWDGLVGMFEQAGAIIGEIVTAIRGTFDENAEGIQSTFGKVADRIGSIMGSISGIVTGILELLREAWRLFGDDILGFVLTAFDAIARVIDGVLRAIKGIIDVVLGVITGDWSRAWDGIKAIFSGVWDAILGIVSFAIGRVKAILGAAWSLISTVVANVWNGITGAISGAWDRIVGAVTGALGRFTGAIRRGLDDVRDWFASLPGRILDALGNVGRMLYDAGKKIIQGLIDGLKAMIGKVGDTMKNVAGKVRDFLPFSPAREGPLSGSGSPDRAGRTIGSMIADGLEASVGDVARAAGRVSGAARIDATGAFSADLTGRQNSGPGGAGGRALTVAIDRIEAFDPVTATRRMLDELSWHDLRLQGAPA